MRRTQIMALQIAKGLSPSFAGMMEEGRAAAGAQELTFLDADVTTEHARVRQCFVGQ